MANSNEDDLFRIDGLVWAAFTGIPLSIQFVWVWFETKELRLCRVTAIGSRGSFSEGAYRSPTTLCKSRNFISAHLNVTGLGGVAESNCVLIDATAVCKANSVNSNINEYDNRRNFSHGIHYQRLSRDFLTGLFFLLSSYRSKPQISSSIVRGIK